jgi:hypothetical protein
VTPAFDVTNPETWPVILTVDHIMAIIPAHKTICGLKSACKRKRFQPAPYQSKPWLWRRADVQRFVEGGRGVQLRRVG